MSVYLVGREKDVRADEGSGVTGRPIREGTSAILVSTDGRLLLQLRDDLPHVSDAGKIGLFGGRREGKETFLECVVREVHEEIGLYLPPERFEFIVSYCGPDHRIPNGTRHAQVFVARGVPVDRLTVTEGRLWIVAQNELERIEDRFAEDTRFALDIFMGRERPAT